MNKSVKKIIFIMLFTIMVVLGSLTTILFSQEEFEGSTEELVKEIDDKMFFKSDLSMEIKMIHTEAGEADEVKTAKIFRKDGKNKFLIIFTSPITDAGSGYLYVDDNLWFYDSESREFIKKTKSESIGGTDAKSRDMEKPSISETYDFVYESIGSVGKIDCWIFYGTAKIDDVAYPKTRIWIRQDNRLPIKREEYSVSDTLSQTVYFLHYTKVKLSDKDEYKYLQDKVLVKDNLEKGKQTLIEFTNISLAELPDNVFTKAYLENQSN